MESPARSEWRFVGVNDVESRAFALRLLSESCNYSIYTLFVPHEIREGEQERASAEQ